MGLDLDESRYGASRSQHVNQADHMCQKLSLRVTIQPEWKIFPLSAFEQIHAVQTIVYELSSHASPMAVSS